MAIKTARWVELTGVITFCSRVFSFREPLGQVRTHTAHPRQIRSSTFAFFRTGFAGSLAETRTRASTGHALTHFPHPLHVSPFTTGRKFVVLIEFLNPNLRAATSASQQHPQQLQMKLTSLRTFSPNCTRLFS